MLTCVLRGWTMLLMILLTRLACWTEETEFAIEIRVRKLESTLGSREAVSVMVACRGSLRPASSVEPGPARHLPPLPHRGTRLPATRQRLDVLRGERQGGQGGGMVVWKL